MAVVAVTDRGRTQPDDLGLRATVLAQPAHRELAASQGVLAFRFLSYRGHRRFPIRGFGTGHELVDEPAGGMPGTGDQGGSHPEPVDGGAAQGGDLPFVEVGGDGDPGARGTQVVEEVTGLTGHHWKVAGIEPDGPQPTLGQLHSLADGGLDVVGVHQQRRLHPQRVELRPEGVLLGIVEEGEGMRGGAHGRDSVGAAGLQVRGGGESRDVGGAGGPDRGPFVGSARSHLRAGPVLGHGGHAGSGRSYGGIEIVDA